MQVLLNNCMYQRAKREIKNLYSILLSVSIVFLSVHIALAQVNEAIDMQDEVALMAGLNNPALSLLEVLLQNSSWYLARLFDTKQQRTQVTDYNVLEWHRNRLTLKCDFSLDTLAFLQIGEAFKILYI